MIKLLLVSLLLMYSLSTLCSCEYNVYLPVEKPAPEHEHNKDKLVQDGDSGHHWECTVCEYATETEPHQYDSYNVCTVCGYRYNQGATGSGGFVINVLIQKPMGHINAQFEQDKKKWVFTIVDDRSEKSQEEYPIKKYTWYVFGEKKSTKATFEFESPYEISYEIYCKFENDYGYADSTVVITGRTE